MTFRVLKYPASTLNFLAIQSRNQDENDMRHFQSFDEIALSPWNYTQPLMVFEFKPIRIFELKPPILTLLKGEKT